MKTYTQNTGQVLSEQNSRPTGLTNAEAQNRLDEHGPNRLQEGKKKSMGRRVWEQIKDPMILVLIAAAIISGAFGEIADSLLHHR